MSKMFLVLFLVLLLGPSTMAGNSYGQQIYTWVDEKGTVHFSDSPTSRDFDQQTKQTSKEGLTEKSVRYKSSFGFTVDIPEHWLVLTREELTENPDLFDFDKKSFGNIDKNLLKNIESQIKSGQVEFYFNQNTSDSSFTDNINVIKQIGKIPENNTQLREVCNSAPKELSSAFGREIKVYQCKLVDINNLKSLFLEYDGAIKGTRNIQYLIQKSPSVQIMITATCKNSVLDTIRKEFNRIVLSIKK